MIQRLRKKFIGAAMLSLTLVLLVILGGVNIVSFSKTVSDADGILSLLSENQGAFPKHLFPGKEPMRGEPPFEKRFFSPETPYESRFFSVTLNKEGSAVFTDTDNIAAIDQQTADQYAQKVAASGSRSGFYMDYRFRVTEQDGTTRIIFLDCRRSLSAFRTTLLASLAVAALGLLGVFVLLIFFSGRIVKPVAESYEKQRQFITDAGHEIKTPLTVISADADLLELECGGSEWLEDIRRQSQRLTGLTNDLIYLSRMDEEKPVLQMVEFPVSDVVEETAQSFLGLAVQQGKALSIHVQPMLSLVGSEKDIRQLTSILLDNALKYSPEASQVSLTLERSGKSICLSVANDTLEPVEKEKRNRMFDRFYRLDGSHNSDTGGYGLGLAIAQGIAAAHKGKIRADSPEERRLVITVQFPTGI